MSEPADPEDGPERDATITAGAPFQVYGLAGDLESERTVCRHSWEEHPRATVSVTIRHIVEIDGRSFESEVSSRAPDEDGEMRAADVLAGTVFTDLLQDDRMMRTLSFEARALRIDQLRHEGQRRAERAASSVVDVPVDGRNVPFELVRVEGGTWCATATIDDVSVAITGDQLEPGAVRLHTIRDPDGYFGAAR